MGSMTAFMLMTAPARESMSEVPVSHLKRTDGAEAAESAQRDALTMRNIHAKNF